MSKTNTKSPEAYFASLPAPRRKVALALRDLICRVAPTLTQTVKWSYPCWVGKGKVCSIIAYREHVNLAFFRGTELPDEAGLLSGTGKGMRHVTIRELATVRPGKIAALVKAAAKLDAQG
jgi:hypothetical protein